MNKLKKKLHKTKEEMKYEAYWVNVTYPSLPIISEEASFISTASDYDHRLSTLSKTKRLRPNIQMGNQSNIDIRISIR